MITEKQSMNPLLKPYISVAEGIAKTFGEFCEVVLHDLTDYSSSIIAIFNGHVTGRKVGSPITNLGLEIIKKGLDGEDNLINYSNTSLQQKSIKSSSMIIRDEAGNIIGCLCINIDTAYLKMAKSFIENLISNEPDNHKKEEFSPSINDLKGQLINEAVERIGKPIPLMNKVEKEKFISYLDNKGLFLIKGAIQTVADLLGISKYTMYNYLDKNC
ncbi:transcriptional regulator [Pseudalkalibacillus sp. A8]|uniref:helix-turn-helix transcriptional regulator n=1 Tax=Pseudalkalibacillus sp. A8 TaxID=3382641 RepID=UPI0038B6242A